MAKLYIQLVGTFMIRDDAGQTYDLRGAKARGLLALLCRTPDGKRSRRWLESKLWSDRGPDQAAGSLRQALMEIRRTLGKLSDHIAADRESVQLLNIDTDLSHETELATERLRQGHEFLENLDIADPEFEDWIREERQRLQNLARQDTRSSQPLAAATGVPLILRVGDGKDDSAQFAGMAIADMIARMAAEFCHVDVFPDNEGGADGPRNGLVLMVNLTGVDGSTQVLAGLRSISDGRLIWSKMAEVSQQSLFNLNEGNIPQLAFEAVEAIAMARLPESDIDTEPLMVNALVAKAVEGMFTYDGAQLRLADTYLSKAQDLIPSDRVLAWRSLLRQIMFVERTETDNPGLMKEADEFSRKAMEISSGNSLTLALVSQVRVMVDADIETGAALARDALLQNPANAFGYAARASILLRADRPAEALEAALSGAQIAMRSSLIHWWYSLAGLSALALGRTDQAIVHYEAAHARAPKFRSPMRHLLFLYLARDDHERAARMLQRLKAAEPGFSMDLIRNDASYPAATLRRLDYVARFAGEL